MIDAMKLAEVLSSCSTQDIPGSLEEYQKEMLSRGSRAVRESRIVVQSQGSLPVIWGHEVREEAWKQPM